MTNFDYSSVASVPKSLLGTTFTDWTPQITQDDIDKQIIVRYFTRQVNVSVGEIVEISREVYNGLQTNNLWQTIQITWRIAGPLDDVIGSSNINMPNKLYTGVIAANTNTTNAANILMPGMNAKLNNPTQHYQF